jgi:hypothetical protein
MPEEALVSGKRAAVIRNSPAIFAMLAAKRDSLELFDIASDPAESKDLAGSRPELADDMEKRLRAWQRSVETSLTGADYK